MRRKILPIIGVLVCFCFVFGIAFFMFLPTHEIARFLEKNIEKAMKQEQTVKIENLSISPLMTATVERFSIESRAYKPVDESLAMEGGTFSGFYCAPYVESQPVVIDEIYIDPDILNLLSKKYGGKFELKIQDGKISGNIATVGNLLKVSANGKEISMNDFALISNMSGMQIYGALGFSLNATLDVGLKGNEKTEENKIDEETAKSDENEEKSDAGRRKKKRGERSDRQHTTGKDNQLLTEANIDLQTTNTALCPKRLNLGGIPLDLPFTVFGDIEASVEIKKNKITIHKLTSTGPDIKLNVTGDITLRPRSNAGPTLNIHAVIQPSESWVTENDMKVIYQMCEKHPDGSIELDLTGTGKRIKHDCGTPIPEPVTVEKKSETKDDKAKDDKAKDDKAKAKDDKAKAKDDKAKVKDEENKKKQINRDEDQNLNAYEQQEDANVDEAEQAARNDRPRRRGRNGEGRMNRRGFGPDGEMNADAPGGNERFRNRDRTVNRVRGDVPSPADFKPRNARASQDMERMQHTVEQDIRRHGRGREQMPNRSYESLDNE